MAMFQSSVFELQKVTMLARVGCSVFTACVPIGCLLGCLAAWLGGWAWEMMLGTVLAHVALLRGDAQRGRLLGMVYPCWLGLS